jgi:peptidoglycan/xylan/chitin deacetylase (PgdA/CDA1 family)
MILGIVLAFAGVLTLTHIAPFPFLLDAAAGRLSVWRGPHPRDKKEIYLTFDDGPNPIATPELLDLLKEKDVRATFFLIDRHLDADTAPIIRRMFEEGHGVALHSADRWLMVRSPSSIERTLVDAADRIEAMAGRRPCPLFRPHAGWRSVTLMSALSRLKYRLVGWSWMVWDWNWFRKRTGERVASQILRHAAPGKIIVIHDGHHKNREADRRYAIDATRRIIDGLRARGFAFRNLCDSLP